LLVFFLKHNNPSTDRLVELLADRQSKLFTVENNNVKVAVPRGLGDFNSNPTAKEKNVIVFCNLYDYACLLFNYFAVTKKNGDYILSLEIQCH